MSERRSVPVRICWSGVTTSGASAAAGGVGFGRDIGRRSLTPFMKLAGRPLRGAGTLALLALLVLPQAAAGAEAPKQDTLVVQAGAFYQETILLPPDGSPWTGSVRVVNGSQAIDLYIVRTVDTLRTYPSVPFFSSLGFD